MRSQRVKTDRVTLNVVMAGEGRPLLLLHGLGWSSRLWKNEIERYSRRYQVIAPDTRGHGDSEVPEGPYSIPGFAEDFIGLLDTLKIKKACIVGFSQGGMAAQELVTMRPDLVEALVLASTTCKSHASGRANMEARIKAMQEEGAEASARIAAKSIFADAFMDANPTYLEEFVKWRTQMNPVGLVAAMRAGAGFDVQPRLSGIKVPTLVIAGTADRLTKPDSVKEVAASIPGAIYKEIEGAGHMLPIETPEIFNEMLEDFLAANYAPKEMVS